MHNFIIHIFLKYLIPSTDIADIKRIFIMFIRKVLFTFVAKVFTQKHFGLSVA